MHDWIRTLKMRSQITGYEALQNIGNELPGLSNDRVGGKDSHPVEGSDWLRLGGELPPNDGVLLQRSLGLHASEMSKQLNILQC